MVRVSIIKGIINTWKYLLLIYDVTVRMADLGGVPGAHPPRVQILSF